MESSTVENIRNYYGQVLQSSHDLKTSACCSTEAMPSELRAIAREVHPEVLERFYGCGSPIPPVLEGKTVLDLGCGTGRDCYILSRLVGESGDVIGLDMTPEQLDVARRHVDYHREKFGFARENVRFLEGYLEDLEGAGIGAESVDVIVSNCVLNLSPDKAKVFEAIFRALKPGGELYFSDIFAGRRLPPHLREDRVLQGECLGGALYIEDFRRLLQRMECHDYRIVSKQPVTLEDPEIQTKVGMIDFYTMTVRTFKLPFEDRCEDYGQIAYYNGGVPGMPHRFMLDDHHRFETARPVPVCSNTAAMLTETRFAPYFQVVGDRATHFGLFDCGAKGGPEDGRKASASCC